MPPTNLASPGPREAPRRSVGPSPETPPSRPQVSVDAGELEVRLSPLLFRAAPDPDLARLLVPLLPESVRRPFESYLALGGSPGDDARDAARAAVLARAMTAIVGANAASQGKPSRRAALLVARGYLSEGSSSGESERDGGADEAAALYFEVEATVPVAEPLGWLARFRHALRLEVREPHQAQALLDALLDAPLADPWMRAALPAVLAHPLRDWGRAARVARALWMSARGALAASSSRSGDAGALHTAWMVATYDDGNWQEALELARRDLLGAGAGASDRGPALAVAAGALVQLGGPRRAPLDLPSETYATLVALTGERALDEGDLAMADEALRLLDARAPASPRLAALRAEVSAFREADHDPSDEGRARGFSTRARGLVGRCLLRSRRLGELELSASDQEQGSLRIRFELPATSSAAVPVVVLALADPLAAGPLPPPWLARQLACAQQRAAAFFDSEAPYGHAVVHVVR